VISPLADRRLRDFVGAFVFDFDFDFDFDFVVDLVRDLVVFFFVDFLAFDLVVALALRVEAFDLVVDFFFPAVVVVRFFLEALPRLGADLRFVGVRLGIVQLL